MSTSADRSRPDSAPRPRRRLSPAERYHLLLHEWAPGHYAGSTVIQGPGSEVATPWAVSPHDEATAVLHRGAPAEMLAGGGAGQRLKEQLYRHWTAVGRYSRVDLEGQLRLRGFPDDLVRSMVRAAFRGRR